VLNRIIRKFTQRFSKAETVRLLQAEFPQHDIGTHSYGGLQIRSFGDDTQLTIGKYCSFAADVQIMLGGEHRPDWVTTYPFNILRAEHTGIKGHPASKGNIIIGNDVWIGREAIILSGVTIGDGAVIAARSIVRKDVAPYTIVGGIPAKEIRKRFDDDVISRLLALRWWDWPDARVDGAVPLLLQQDITKFLDAAEAEEI